MNQILAQNELFAFPSNEPSSSQEPSKFFINRSTPTTTVIYDTYWKFAALRQEAFFNRTSNSNSSKWTDDPILQTYKFTNAYRAADRVSQYLIKNVIYDGDQSIEETFFRIILFKLFNKIETWELLKAKFGILLWSEFSFSKYDKVLGEAISSGVTIYSAAYIMASAKSAFGKDRKHSNHLLLLSKMMNDRLPYRIQQLPSLEEAYITMLTYPSIGPFLAYQYVIDLNYSLILNFSEDDFVVPGPGSLSGISKCFSDTANWSPADIIKLVTENQEYEFERLKIEFKTLWGRRLHLIDCQNLFCETDKYSRVRHPEFTGQGGRSRIKQVHKPNSTSISYWFPPKWGMNE